MQTSKKGSPSRPGKSSSGVGISHIPLKSRDKSEDRSSTSPLTASLEELTSRAKDLSGISGKNSGSETPASWKDTFLMVGGAVVVAALLEGARRLSGKKFGSLSDVKSSISEVTSSFKSGSKSGRSAEPGKRIPKGATALKGKSGYPSQVGGKSSKKKKSAAAAGVARRSKKSTSAGAGVRRASREY